MHCLIVSAVYPPEPVVSAQTTSQVTAALLERGHKVTVLTAFPNRPAGRLYPGWKRRLFSSKDDGKGARLIRCPSTLSPRSTLFSRFMENLSFGLCSSIALLFQSRPDVVYSVTWPLVAGGLTQAAAGLRGIPLVANIQDIYPESLVSQGRFNQSSFAMRALTALDGVIARSAHRVIVISEGFRRTYQESRRVAGERIHVVPNWIDPEAFRNGGSETLRDRLGLGSEAFLAVYGGNIGVAAGVETVIEAFKRIQDAPELHLIIAGEGSRLEECRQLAEAAAKDKVTFYTPWPASETAMVLRSASVLILPTAGAQSLVSVPSKLLSYMLSGRPVIAMAQPGSETERIILSSGCGWVVRPEDPDQLAEAIQRAARLDAKTLDQMGEKGRECVRRDYSSASCVGKIVEIIESAAAVNAERLPVLLP